MARALTIHRATIPPVERARYFARLRARKAHYGAANCRYWVFEESALAGAFIECIEADDPRTLVAAHESAPDTVLAPVRVYEQVEID